MVDTMAYSIASQDRNCLLYNARELLKLPDGSVNEKLVERLKNHKYDRETELMLLDCRKSLSDISPFALKNAQIAFLNQQIQLDRLIDDWRRYLSKYREWSDTDD
ncbi:MAG: hypothetical protein JWM00_324 [Candidatus Saccharibacteria bacterium]|nr:hypothetical protein [Candidatus Saccharibacteria bacterium]